MYQSNQQYYSKFAYVLYIPIPYDDIIEMLKNYPFIGHCCPIGEKTARDRRNPSSKMWITWSMALKDQMPTFLLWLCFWKIPRYVSETNIFHNN